MRAVNLIPIDEPAGQEVMLIPVDEGAGNSPFPKVPTGYQPPDRSVVGIATPQDQQAADTFQQEYIQKPASGVLARAVRAIKLYAFPVAKAMDSISGKDEHQARLAADIDELSGFIKEQQPGPEVGEVGKFVRGVEELVPQIAAGPAGMVNMLSTAAADKGLDALDQGVDPTTATMLAGKQAAETAAFMKLPQIGKTLPRSIAIGAAGNPATGTLGRAADVGILEATGHQQQADAVKVIDPAAMAHEAATGAMFSVDGHIRNSLARSRQPEEQQRTAAPEGREVELVPLDGAEPPSARQPQPTAPVDPELASSLKWAAERLLDPATPALDRQNLKRMLNDNNPQKLELVRSYRREQERQQKPAMPEGQEVELIPLAESDNITKLQQSPEGISQNRPLSDYRLTPETQPEAAKILPDGQVSETGQPVSGAVEQIAAGKRGNQDIYDLTLNRSQQRTLEEIRQAVNEGQAGGRVMIEQDGQGGTAQTVGYGSTFPDWFSNKGYGKAETIKAVDFALAGEGVTARQKIMLEDLLQGKRMEDTNAILNQRSQPSEVPAYRLNEGDTLKRNGEPFKVVEVSPEGVTLKDGEIIHLNHEQTINYDRGSLKDADGKLVKRTPEQSPDDPFADLQAPPAMDAEAARQAAAQSINQVIPEAAPAVGLSVKQAPKRDDNINLPDNQAAEQQTRSADPEVEKRWQAAHGLSDGPGLIDRTKDFLHRMLSETQHFPNLDTSSFSGKRTADILRRFESSDVAAKAKSAEYLHSLTASFGPKKMDLFTRKVILDDLITEAAKERALPFGYTPETVKADHDRISRLVEANPDIKAAVERRAEVSKHLVLELVDNDLLPVESVLTPEGLERYKQSGKYGPDDINTTYYRHQVLQHANAKKWAGISTAGEVRNKQRGWQKQRQGSEQDINTNFLEAEFEVHTQSMKELATKKALDEVLRVNDIGPELKEQAKKDGVKDWRTLIPEDHVTWQPEKGSVFYKGQTLPEQIITRFAEENPAFADVMQQFRQATILGGRKHEAIIPQGLAKTLDNLRTNREDATLDTINKKLVGGWKIWTLLSPRRALKYNLNNMSGDMDIALAADPGILRHFGTAWRNGLNRKAGRAMSKDEVDMLERGVIDAGISINEIPDISKLPGFQHLKQGERNVKLLEVLKSGSLTKLMPPNLIAKYFDTVSGLTQFREGLLREAAYLRAKELLQQGKKIYWASKPAEIEALPDIRDRAAKLSRELIGDYGNISAHGEKIRTTLIPFFSWMEINSPRYYRLFKNAATRGEAGSTAARMAGVGTRKAAGAALGVGEKLLLANLLFAAVNTYNHLLFPEEEKKLGDSTKGQMHIILGTTTDGKILTSKFSGAFADSLAWFGLEDYPETWRKLQQDRMDSNDLLKKMALATPNKLAGGAVPFHKLGAELITGKSFWPDIEKPRPIRDKGEHAARFLALDEEYKALTGKPTRGYLDGLKKLMVYEQDPGEIAYQNTRSRAMEFLKKAGKEIPASEPTARSNALYYWRQAVKYQEREAIAHYKEEYLKAGGKLEGLQKSIDRAHPLALLPLNMRYKFRQSLTAEEQEAFKEGLDWYVQTYKPR